MKTNLFKQQPSKLVPKRMIYDAPEMDRESEAENITDRIALAEEKNIGIETPEGIETQETVDGKTKAVALEIKAVYDKVKSLGENVFLQFSQFLREQAGINLEPIERMDADHIQDALDDKIYTDFETNNEKLRELDNGLEQILYRAQLRKELAIKLAPLPRPEQEAIGSKFEEKIAKFETTLQPLNQTSFFSQYEVMHEFSKYARLIDLTRRMGATPTETKRGVENAQVIPEIGIAYGAPGNENYFKHWSEASTDSPLPNVYALDKKNARIQKFNWEGEGHGANAWIYVDVPGKEYGDFPKERLRELAPKESDLQANDLEKMRLNQQLERKFIDAASRNYQAPSEENALWELSKAEFVRRENENRTAYESQADHPPLGSYLRDMAAYLKRPIETRASAEETAEVNLNTVELQLAANQNPALEKKENHFELKSGKIEADRTLLSFDAVGTDVSMAIDETKSPTLVNAPNAAPINIFREYFEVTNNKVNFKRNHPGKAAIYFDVGSEITIPIKLKKGDQEASREIKIQIKEKPPTPPQPSLAEKKADETIAEIDAGQIKDSIEDFTSELRDFLSEETPMEEEDIENKTLQEKKKEIIAQIGTLADGLETKTPRQLLDMYQEMVDAVRAWKESVVRENAPEAETLGAIDTLVGSSLSDITSLRRLTENPAPTPSSSPDVVFEDNRNVRTLPLSALRISSPLANLKAVEAGKTRTLTSVERQELNGQPQDISSHFELKENNLILKTPISGLKENDTIRFIFTVDGIPQISSINIGPEPVPDTTNASSSTGSGIGIGDIAQPTSGSVADVNSNQ